VPDKMSVHKYSKSGCKKSGQKKEPSIRYNKPIGEHVKTWAMHIINCIWTKNVHPGRFHSVIFLKKVCPTTTENEMYSKYYNNS
jgi:hypothetical protein